jgi:hypothetical protein
VARAGPTSLLVPAAPTSLLVPAAVSHGGYEQLLLLPGGRLRRLAWPLHRQHGGAAGSRLLGSVKAWQADLLLTRWPAVVACMLRGKAAAARRCRINRQRKQRALLGAPVLLALEAR